MNSQSPPPKPSPSRGRAGWRCGDYVGHFWDSTLGLSAVQPPRPFGKLRIKNKLGIFNRLAVLSEVGKSASLGAMSRIIDAKRN